MNASNSRQKVKELESHMDTPEGSQQQATAGQNEPPPTMWVAHCPFRKTGSPVLGTFGRDIRPVVVMTMATWNRLCRDVPALQTMQFNVGTFE